jgi:hypothetical protein
MCGLVSAGSVALRLVTLEHALAPDACKRPFERVIWRRTQERVRACDSMRGFTTQLLIIGAHNFRMTFTERATRVWHRGRTIGRYGGAICDCKRAFCYCRVILRL